MGTFWRGRPNGGLAAALPLLCALWCFSSGPPATAAARQTTVAVMPFRDLSGGSPYIGEAIRETVTSDLKQLGMLRLVERGNLDKLLAEQGLQARKTELDVKAVVKLGKVLGASLIVIGAYQKVAPQLRLTARFVNVETSEVIGTAKVDGTTRDFLRLQDRITAALLRSAGFPVHAKRFEEDAPKRPELLSLKTVELYGQAAAAPSDDERRQYLRAAVAEDRSFSYALRDLEALEQRLRAYQTEAQPIQERELAQLRAQIQQSADREQAAQLLLQLLGKLASAHKWHTLVREARGFLESLPPGAKQTAEVDLIALQLVQYDGSLKDQDAVLRDGEWYLKRAPGSSQWSSIDALVKQAIERKRLLEENRRQVQAELTQGGKAERWNLCAVADMCRSAEQYAAALRFYEACGQLNQLPAAELFPLLLLTTYNGGLWVDLHRQLTLWDKVDSRSAQKWEAQSRGFFPVDE